MGSKIYAFEFTPSAETQKQAIPMNRRLAFDTGIHQLMENPRREPARQLSDGTWRVRVTQHIAIYYAIFDFKFVVAVVEVNDDKDTGPQYLVKED